MAAFAKFGMIRRKKYLLYGPIIIRQVMMAKFHLIVHFQKWSHYGPNITQYALTNGSLGLILRSMATRPCVPIMNYQSWLHMVEY